MQEQNDVIEAPAPTPVLDGIFMQGSLKTHPGRVYELPVIEEAAVIPEDLFNGLSVKKIESEDTPKIPIILQITRDELINCFKLAQEFKTAIDSAKTTVKKNYLKKKSSKNSEYAVKLINFINVYNTRT